MPPAAAASRASSSSRPRSRSRSQGSSSRRYLWYGIAAAVLLVVLYVLHKRGSQPSAAAVDTSGTPGPDMTGSFGSGAVSGGGGAGGVTGNLPRTVVTEPDPVQQQVQQTDTSSAEAPAMLAPPVGIGDAITLSTPVQNPPGDPTPLVPDPGTLAAVTGTPIYQAPAVGTTGTVSDTGATVPALVDVSGHVVSPKGTRVGGVPVDVG